MRRASSRTCASRAASSCSRPWWPLALREAVSTRLLAERYDVVHAHWLVPNAAMVQDIARAHTCPWW